MTEFDENKFEDLKKNATIALDNGKEMGDKYGLYLHICEDGKFEDTELATIKSRLNKLTKEKIISEATCLLQALGRATTVLDLFDDLFIFDKETEEQQGLFEKYGRKNMPRGTTNSTLEEFDKYMKQVNEKLTSWGDGIVSDMRKTVKEEVSATLPEVVKEAVKEVSKNTKFTKPWADLFKKSQEELKHEAKRAFESTLTENMTENQHKIIEKVQATQDVENFEKEKRSRNIIIKGIPQSLADTPQQRKQHDLTHVREICGIDNTKILKCIRAGSNAEDRDKINDPRLLIVTLPSPKEAKELHRYGNGSRKMLNGKVVWINPDLTQKERDMNFKCRQLKREHQRSTSSTNKPNFMCSDDTTKLLS